MLPLSDGSHGHGHMMLWRGVNVKVVGGGSEGLCWECLRGVSSVLGCLFVEKLFGFSSV